MHRRSFLGLGLLAPAAGVLDSKLAAQQGPAREERIEGMTPDPTPAIALNHLGFLPQSKKVVIVRYAGDDGPANFTIRDIGGPQTPFRETRPLKRDASAVIPCLVGDFSDIERPAMY